LPEEIKTKVWRAYFSSHVLPKAARARNKAYWNYDYKEKLYAKAVRLQVISSTTGSILQTITTTE